MGWDIRFILKDVRVHVAFVLLLVWLFAIADSFSFQKLAFPILGVALVGFFDVLFALLKKEKIRFPSGSLVTGLLIGLVLFPFEHPLALPLAVLGAVASKQLLRPFGRHIFNPAAFGIVLASLVFGVSVSWWVAAQSPLTIIPVVFGMGFVLFRLKRILLPVLFLVTYGVYLSTQQNLSTVSAFIFDPTTIFFAFIMLPELATSPATGFWRFAFGPLVGVFAILITFTGLFSEVFLPGLLLSNLASFLIRELFKNRKVSPVAKT